MPDPVTHTAQPHNAEAESTTIGALLLDPERIHDVAATLRADDFYDPTYRTIYEAIQRVHESRRPVDFVTVAEELANNQRIQEIGGTAFLASLAQNVPTASHAAHYAAIVREKALHRSLMEVGCKISTIASDERIPAEEAVERAEQAIMSLSRKTADRMPQHIADVGTESYERYARLYEAEDKTTFFGLTTGFHDLDLMLTGLPPGCLAIVAARPSAGKSSLALDIARHAAAKQSKNVAVFSLEMTKQELMDRTIAGMLGIEAWRLKKGDLTPEDFARMGPLFDGLIELRKT